MELVADAPLLSQLAEGCFKIRLCLPKPVPGHRSREHENGSFLLWNLQAFCAWSWSMSLPSLLLIWHPGNGLLTFWRFLGFALGEVPLSLRASQSVHDDAWEGEALSCCGPWSTPGRQALGLCGPADGRSWSCRIQGFGCEVSLIFGLWSSARI